MDPTQLYNRPAITPGRYCYLYGPWFETLDLSLGKRIPIGEKPVINLRAQALNVFNHPNLLLVPNSPGNITINTMFGQTRNAFYDIDSTNDPGSRI